ncbi:MAG: adenosylmethionine--8-amino-7-oxononanoate transaminase [Myxococcales bacterium]|nr:MAG: adenosylmethionine--8-amino-7-oxononanoate transaminase [Myxococcales bacterium]
MGNETERLQAARLRELDARHVWHPFTQMNEWQDGETLLIERGEGVYLYDVEGRRYLDGVSSLWCNVHGHRHPIIDRYVREQLDRLAHSTFLGLSHAPAVRLAAKLAEIAPERLTRVFFSDSGSTAVEAAVKIAYQYHQQNGEPARTAFAALSAAYHGDTLGSVSLGGIDLFHAAYRPLLFDVVRVPTPAPYRDLPIDPSASDAELARHPAAAPLLDVFRRHGERLCALVMEPLVQGAAGMLLHPKGFLALARRLCDRYGALLVLDEVATGFGRTGTMFACEQERVAPDLMAVAKGLTGGYLPVAATLAAEAVFDAFRGAPESHRTFYHGHTYTANPLGCAAALGSLDVFEREQVMAQLPEKVAHFKKAVERLRGSSHVGDIRIIGLMAAVDLLRDPAGGQAYPEAWRMGYKVCMEARRHGVIVRPLGDSVVLMPPLAVLPQEIDLLVAAIQQAIERVCR